MKDIFGIFASGLCVLHCLSTPFLLGAAVWFGEHNHNHAHSHALFDERVFHAVMLLIVTALSVWSFPSAFKIHRRTLPVYIAIIGVICLITGIFLPLFEQTLISLVGGGCLISAHIANKQYLSKASSSSSVCCSS